MKCLMIMMNDDGIAYIDNISYFDDCIDTGLKYPGGGTILLKMAIQFIMDNKTKYKIKKIQLRDTSYLFCQKTKEK